MEISIFCVVIALTTAIIGASPRKAFLMGGLVAFVAGFVAFAVENGPPDLYGIYRVSIFAVLFALPAALMSFIVAKLKR